MECFGVTITRIFILMLFCVMSITHHQCKASQFTDSEYDRVLDACQEKLAAWKNDSSAGRPRKGNSSPLYGGAYVRGRWKQAAVDAHGVPVSRPYFLETGEGMFDLYALQSIGLQKNTSSTIQNITAQLFLRGQKSDSRRNANLQAMGIYNTLSGQVCFSLCEGPVFRSYVNFNYSVSVFNATNGTDPTPYVYQPYTAENEQNCSIRGLFTISGKSSGLVRMNVDGNLESLNNVSESQYFTPISLKGSMVKRIDQKSLFRMDIIVRSLIFAVEIVVVLWQLIHSIRSPSGYFVSMLMILVQIVAMGLLAVRLIYIPLRLLTYRNFKYLMTNLSLIPYFIAMGIILLDFAFFWVIFRKRRVAKKMNVEERPRELLLGITCIVIYAVTGVVLWSLQNFETYLQVVWCWFLLPQLIANVFWDLRTKPLCYVYVVGLSLCRISYLGFNALRPTIYGYDDLEDFPHSWFWGVSATILLFASYSTVQQRYGGRVFLPQRWFGYRQLPSSNAQAIQEPTSANSKRDGDVFDNGDDDDLFDL